MSVTAAIPLSSMPSTVRVPPRPLNIGSSAMPGGAITSPVSNNTQPPPQINQASLTPSSRQNSLHINIHSCKIWIKSHPLLSIAGIVIALATLLVGYYQARAADIFTSKGNSLAETALDYTRYQTWCQNSGIASNYTWCQDHRTPDTFDPAFNPNQRRSLSQSWDSLKSTCLTYIAGNNDWREGKWSKGTYWTLSLLSLSVFVHLLFSRLVATTMPKPTALSKQYLYLVELDYVELTTFTVILLVPVLGALPLGLVQPPFEDFVFYLVAAIMLVPGFRRLYLLFPLMIAYRRICYPGVYSTHVLSVCTPNHKCTTHKLTSSAPYLNKSSV